MKKVELKKPVAQKVKNIIALYGDLEHNTKCGNKGANDGNCTC